MAGLKRHVGAVRVLAVAPAPTDCSGDEKPVLAHAAPPWHILGEDGKSRTLAAVSAGPATASRPAAAATGRHPSLAEVRPPASSPAANDASRPPPSSSRRACHVPSGEPVSGSVDSIGPPVRCSGAPAISIENGPGGRDCAPRPPGLRPAGAGISIGSAIREAVMDIRLVRLVNAWATLPLRVRDAILAMIDGAGEARSPGDPSKTS